MISSVTQDGVTYVERDYKCLDCDWAWNQVCVKGDIADMPSCPNCQNKNRHRFDRPARGEKIKTSIGKRKQKKHDIDWKNPKVHFRTKKGAGVIKAASMAFDEAQKQGFTDMKDSGLRNGDICAPPLTSLVAQVQDRMFGGGWSGGTAPAYAGANPVDSGGKEIIGALQAGIINGSIPDKLRGVGDLKR